MTTPLVTFVELQVPQIIMALIAASGLFGGAVLARRSKREENAQAAAATTMEASISGFDQMKVVAAERVADLERANARADRAEAKTDRITAEWEARWSRQMDRCRQITDASAQTIARLIARVPDPGATEVLHDLEDHKASDHS